jgi:hypothetical protein
LQRYLGALKRVRAPILAQQALNIALTDEIPAHSDSIRMRLIFGAPRPEPDPGLAALRDHVDQVMKPIRHTACYFSLRTSLNICGTESVQMT